MAEPSGLARRWAQTCAAYDAPPELAHDLWVRLAERYSEPQRAYHDLTHLEHAFAVWDTVSDLAADPARCALVLWLHDVIYDPLASDNEARSADLAREWLPALGVADDDVRWVARAIEATKAHTATGDADADLVIDVDMSILGADEPTFDAYDRNIREEYPDVSDEVFATHRSRFLTEVLDRPRVFLTDALHDRLEAQARDNCARARARLAPPPPRGILLVVFTTIFLDLVGFGIIIPILPFYAETFGASAALVTLLGAAYSLMQFLFTPVWGRLSDRIGRRPVLLVSIAIAAVGYVIFGLAGALWVLFAARILQGLGTANIATAQAIIADVTPPERRANGMAIVGVAFGLGFIIGPAIGGIAGQWGIAVPALVAAALSAINLLFVIFLMPETRPAVPDSAQTERPAGLSLQTLRRALSMDRVPRLLLLYFGVGTAFALMEQVLGLFIEHYWLPGEAAALTATALSEARAQEAAALTTWLLIAVGVTAVIVQGAIVGRLANRFGERPLVIVGIALEAVGILAMPAIGWTGSFPLLIAGGVVLAVGSGLLSPSLTSLLSVAAPADEQGSILGLGQSLSALGRVLGPAVAGLLFQFWVPLPFYVGGLMLVACVVVAMGIPGRDRPA